jgi:hypothetical protein
MAMTDDQLAQQVHDAYEKIELSDDAQDRMLAALLAASDAKQVEPSADRGPSRRTTKGRVTQMPKRQGLKRWMPMAAVLLAALVVVQVGVLTVGNHSGETRADMAPKSEESMVADSFEVNASDGVAFETSAPQEGEAKADSAASEDVDSSEVSVMVGDYPLITLSDGTELVARPEQVDLIETGDLLEETTARSVDGEQSVTCRVYELVGGGYAVSYEGEETYWLCD